MTLETRPHNATPEVTLNPDDPNGYRKTRINDHDLRPESLMMGYGYRPQWSEGALKCPLFQTSTFVFETAEEGKAFFEVAYGLREPGSNENLGLIYSRLNNPDLEILEDRLTLWDGAEACAVFESGMAAIATALLAHLRPGDVLLHSEPLYGGTDHLIRHFLTDFGVRPACFPAGGEARALEEVVADPEVGEKVRMVLVETPANPTNALVDIGRLVRVARRLGGDRQVIVAVDNTFLGPLWQRPLDLGADLVLYSMTKYIGGHSDLIAGACLGSRELLAPVRTLRTFLGTMAGPWTGWLVMRSLETLKLRMTCQMKNARYVADFLADHPKVDRVHYLGHLEAGDPQWEVYRRQCLAPGAMISFEVRGGEPEAFRLLNGLELFKLAVSLGGTESLAEHPATMTHADVPSEAQERMGISPALIRLSIGVEHPEDLIADLKQAVARV
jgi:methionine-gamma-lyase